MRDSGFTLTETLAALLIIGLAFGGLFEATRLIARIQLNASNRVVDAQGLGMAGRAMQAWLADEDAAAALNANRLRGDGRRTAYPCGGGECRLSFEKTQGAWSLTLTGRDNVAQKFALGRSAEPQLVYDAIDGRFDHWPPSGRPRVLRALSVVQSGGDGVQPVLTARAWIEQTRTCQYDLISRACRPATSP